MERSHRELSFVWDAGKVTASVDGEAVVSDLEVGETANEFDDSVPGPLDEAATVPLVPTSVLTISGTPSERARILDLLQPDDELAEELVGYAEESPTYDDMAWEKEPVGPELLIDSVSYAWLQTDEGWKVVPRNLRASLRDVARLSDWMSASMTGMVVDAGCVAGDGIALSWMWNDVDGLRWLEVDYEPGSPAQLANQFFSDVFGDYDPLCFVDEADGWETEISIGKDVPDEVLGHALTLIRRPCKEHDRPDLEWRLGMDGSWWRWTGTTFVRDEPQDPE